MKNFQQLTVLAGMLALFAVTPAFAAVTSDYTNYWSFDEATGRSANDTTGGQNGALTGSSTGFGWVSGKVGTALVFDGVIGEAVALPNGFLKGSQGSLSVWLKLDALSDGNIIFSGKSTTDNNIYTALSIDRDGRPLFQFRDATNGNDRKAQGTKLLNKNEWYNLVLTANGQTYHMYLNGEEVIIAGDNIGRWFPDITNQTLMYRIGANDATPMSGVFQGILDEVKVYDRALTMEDITALYNEGNVGIPSVPLAIRPALNFSISNDHVPFGGLVTLKWSGTNLTSCVADGSWSGVMPASGTQTFSNLGGDATYGLNCSGNGGSTHATVRVFVAEKGATATTVTSSGTGLTVTTLSTSTNSTIKNDIKVTAISGGQTMTAISDTEKTRRATIQKMIDQLLVLIGELQKQLALLKMQGTSTGHY
jgi:hypothetical protein